MTATTVVFILAALLGVQPITTDLYLPTLPALTAGFGAGMAQAQLTLTGLLLAFGVSQLVWGPLSDHYGRRPVLLVGLAAYIVAAIGSALAASMELLVLWRIVQGAAMGAGVTCARAIIRDLYDPVEGARVMSKALSGLGVVACLSSPVGGLLSDWFGWRIALLTLAVFGAVSLALVASRFQESLAHKSAHTPAPLSLARNWLQVARNPTFLTYSLLSAASYGGLFTFLASSSFIYIQVLGLGTTEYGFLMFSVSFAYLSGTFLCRRLLTRLGVRRTVAVGSAMSLSGGSLLGLSAYLGLASGPHGAWYVTLPYYLFMLGHGINQPCGQSGAVGPFPRAAGAAAALNGFGMMLVAFFVGGWLGERMDGTVLPLVHGIWFWSVVIAATGWTLVQKYGDVDHGSAPAR